jgi:hypothetical protein
MTNGTACAGGNARLSSGTAASPNPKPVKPRRTEAANTPNTAMSNVETRRRAGLPASRVNVHARPVGASCDHAGLPNQKSPSIILCMSRGTSQCGTLKCRNFTRLVNFLQTTRVISTALAGFYCFFFPRPIGDSACLNQTST